jgi:hypothetical protein
VSVISAPPRKNIFLIWGQYGTIGGARIQPRGRLWLLTDELSDVSSRLFARIAWNHPQTGQVVYEDLGDVASARITGSARAEVFLESGQTITFVTAPCVCGAGSVGQAAPEEGRISLQYVNPYGRPRLTLS